MQANAATIRKGFVAGEFMTHTYRISGEVDLHGEPVLDQLNDANALFISLERMFVSPLEDPAVLTGNFPTGEVRKDNVGIVAITQLRDGLPMREGLYMGRDNIDREVLAVVAGFEVKGVMRLHPSVNLANFVRTTPERFIPIFNATAILAARRDIAFRGGAILINRRHLEVFCVI